MFSSPPPNALLPKLRDLLLQHYREHARDLPWRTEPTPYRVWISEIMLQQTRVDTVVGYFERWMQRFPDLEHLATASENDVLLCWQGLGYYSRARNLHRCARVIHEDLGGRFPEAPEELRKLPGIGPYTAGAIASIAHGRPAAIVDGNVQRVLARTHDIDLPIDSRDAHDLFWQLAQEWASHTDPGSVNQALMEFGATVCTPRRPTCDVCPVAQLCLARQRGTVALRPVPRSRKAPALEPLTAWILREPTTGRVLLVRQPDRRRFGGLWAPPVAPGHANDPRDGFGTHFHTKLPQGQPVDLPPVRHLLTHRDLRVQRHLLDVSHDGGEYLRLELAETLGSEHVRWTKAETLPLSTFARRLLEAPAHTAG